MRIARHLLVAAVLSACQGNSPTTSGDTNIAPSTSAARAELGQPFDLKIGESTAVGDEGLRITFSKVVGDSRCPIDAICVWAGDAEVAIKAQRASDNRTLSLHTMLDPKTVAFQSYKVALVHVTPAPRASQPVPARDYVARLIVTK